MNYRKVFKNTFASILLQVVVILSGLIIPRYIILVYGSQINGLRASLYQFVSYLYVFEMGLHGAGVYALYKPLSTNNVLEIKSIIKSVELSYKKIGRNYIFLSMILVIMYYFLFNKDSIAFFRIAVLVFSISLPSVINYFLTGKKSMLLMASMNGNIISYGRLIYIISNAFILILAAKNNLTVEFAFLLSSTANIPSTLFVLRTHKKKFPFVSNLRKSMPKVIENRSDVMTHQLAGMIIFNSPFIILTIIGDLEMISVFSIYFMIFSGLNMIFGILSSNMIPLFGNLIASKKNGEIGLIFNFVEIGYYILITVVYSCALTLTIPFMILYTSKIVDMNYLYNSFVVCFVAIGLFNQFKMPQTVLIQAAGLFRQTKHRAIIESILAFGLALILVNYYGINGILVGSFIGVLYRSLDIFTGNFIIVKSSIITIKRIIISLASIFLNYLILSNLIFVNIQSGYDWLVLALITGSISLVISIIMFTLFEYKQIKALFQRVCKILLKIKVEQNDLKNYNGEIL